MAKKETDQKVENRTILYVALGLVVIAILALAIMHFSGSVSKPATQNYSVISTPSANAGQVPGNVKCPCLSSQQIQSIVNESALESKSGVYNTTSTSNFSITSHYTPPNFSGGISTLWIASYRDFNSSEADELVAQTNNPSGLYNLAINGSSTIYNSTFKSGPEVNGFTYSYLTLSHVGPGLDNVTTFYLLYGYKGGYAVSFNFITKNQVYPNSSTLAAEIAPTV